MLQCENRGAGTGHRLRHTPTCAEIAEPEKIATIGETSAPAYHGLKADVSDREKRKPTESEPHAIDWTVTPPKRRDK